jgi:DNA-binding SARP family transcriptional activator
MLEFRLLGPLQVLTDGSPISLGGPKQRATLAILLLHANRVVSVDRLADDLYAGAPPVTAVTQVQRQISELRKALGAGASTIETRAPGYLIRVGDDQVDLHRFEGLAGDGRLALDRGDADAAAELLREGLALWRGAPLADLAYEAFAQVPVARLEEIRLAGLEERIEAELALGRHAQLVGELEQLIAEHPLRERFRAQLMLALYRAGRQAEALDVYRRTREELVNELGIEPGSAIRELERAILAQDPSLDLKAGVQVGRMQPSGPTLVLPRQEERMDELLAIAATLAKASRRELIVVRLLTDSGDVSAAAARLGALSASFGVVARSASFTTDDLAREVARLETNYGVDLVLLDASADLAGGRVPDEVAAILEHSAADVGVLAGSSVDPSRRGGVFVPFGGGVHDWAALELGAAFASASGLPLRLVGTKVDPGRNQRDASRLLADASLAVQRVVEVRADPVLADPTTDALLAAVEPATLIVAGISERWRREGIGVVRRALVCDAAAPTLLVHRGPRPSALAPRESRTRFTWSLQA